jgi:hypothetical protein
MAHRRLDPGQSGIVVNPDRPAQAACSSDGRGDVERWRTSNHPADVRGNFVVRV